MLISHVEIIDEILKFYEEAGKRKLTETYT